MSLEILQTSVFEGPNRFDPRSGLFALVLGERDRSRAVRAALKDAAQRIGLVIGSPEIHTRAVAAGCVHEVFVVTPMPALGAAALRYVVDLLNARAAGDAAWDEEEPLWELQKRRRAEGLPLRALQLVAEAAARGVPSFVRADGGLQLGYGAFSRTLDLAALHDAGRAGAAGAPLFTRSSDADVPDWGALGAAPIIAITGGPAAATAVAAFGASVVAELPGVVATPAASFAEARACLSDPGAQMLILGLNAADLLRRGLPFDRCTIGALVDLPDGLVAEAGGRAELARALGVMLLVTEERGRVILNADDPAILALAEYVQAPAILMSAIGERPELVRHRAAGGSAIFYRDGRMIVAQGAAESGAPPAVNEPAAALTLAALRLARELALG